MVKQSQHIVPLIERAVSLLVLVILMTFTYAFFFQVRYQGFDFARNSIVGVFTPGELRAGDELVQIGPVLIPAFEADLRETIFDNAAPGDVTPVVIRRGGQLLTIQWTLPGFNYSEFLARLTSQWWLAFVFWLAGEVVLLTLRPRNTRWRLLIAFNSLTALWLSASSLSRWHVWESAIVLRMAIWLSVPVYLHLHWVFPRPLAPTLKWVWPLLYLIGALLAAAQWFQLLPVDLYQVGFLLALAGSALLLLAHYVFRPLQRSEVGFLAAAGALALLPPVGLGLLITGAGVAVPAILLALLFLPILPFAYIYAAYRRQLGELELRANQAVAVYLFLAGLGTVALTLAVTLDTQFNSFGANILIDAVLITVTALLAIFGFAPFQRFVEHRLLGMPLPPAELVESYAGRITVSLDQKALAKLLTGELLPSLLIRQSALLRFDGNGFNVVCAEGVDTDQLPTADDLPGLLTLAGRYRPPADDTSAPQSFPWVRLALRLSVEQKPVGLWLLGRRDPEDYYSQREIAVLESLANQTAIALTNIIYADRLRALYQNDIGQREAERGHLARELHDNALHQLLMLKRSVEEPTAALEFPAAYELLAADLRQIISDLRPATLNYGLRPALNGLVDALSGRDESGPAISLDVSGAGESYGPEADLHTYRIVQQACENALEHAHPKTLTIGGRLEPELIDLTIEDDGQGFDADAQLDLAKLVANRHFGLAGLYERAAIIGAELQIDSAPGRGTRVTLTWRSRPK